MRSAFFGLHVTTSGLNTARASLNTIAHNIANVETPGFSRQVAIQQATRPLRGAPGRGMVGTGSHITGIVQIRNQFLDTKFWSQNSVLGQFNKKFDVLTLVQGILNDQIPGVGMTHDTNNVFARMSDLTTNAGESTYRRNFLSALETKAISLNSQFQQLRQQQIDLNQEISVVVGQINSLGIQITSLNRQITVLELDGSNANDLRDQRALLIDQLSRLVNIEVREDETNPEFAAGRVTDPRESRRQLSIIVNGFTFVNHFNMQEIEVRPRVLEVTTPTSIETHAIARNPEELGAMYDIFWANGMRFNMYSPSLRGELAGLINLRDGNAGNFASFVGTNDFVRPPTALPAPPPGVWPVTAFENPSGYAVRMQFAPGSRVDMSNTGIISVNGVNFRYTEFRLEFDASGNPVSGIFNLYPGDIPDAALVPNPFAATTGITIGRTTSYMGIPYFKARINEMVRTLAAAFNEGRRLDGSEIPDVIGHIHGVALDRTTGFAGDAELSALLLTHRDAQGNVVTWDGSAVFNYFNITADNFIVNPILMGTPALLRLSGNDSDLPSGYHLPRSWSYINTDRGLFREGRLGDFIAAITGDLGVTGRQAQNFSRSYGELMTTIQNQREAVKGVSMNEEVAFMLQHQMVFQAAARLFSVIDGIYDTLINRMGNW